MTITLVTATVDPGDFSITVQADGVTVGTVPVKVTRAMQDGTQVVRTIAATATTLTGLDQGAPLNEPVFYIVEQGADVLTSNTVTIVTEKSWLQSAVLPSLYHAEVEIVDDLDIAWEQQGAVHVVIGSRLPIPVTDVRLVRRGTLRLYVPDYFSWAVLRQVIDTGHTLTLRPCDRRVIENGNLYVQNVGSVWVGKAGGARIVDLTYRQVTPVTTPDPALGAWTFGDLRDTGDTYQQVKDQFTNYQALLLNQPAAASLGW